MGFMLAKRGSRRVQTSGYEQEFPKIRSVTVVRATTSANIDRTQRRIPDAGIAGVEHIPLVKNYVAE